MLFKNHKVYFSIILPTYNRLDLLPKAVDSVLAQTYQNFELIIIDDGSSDGTREYIKKNYASRLESEKIKYIYKENSGVCKTRNVGLRVARYPWIAYIDSDNEITSDFLEIYKQAIEQHRNTILFYACVRRIKSHTLIGGEFDYKKLLHRNFIDLGTFVHHRSLYDQLGGFDENMTRLVDWELIIRYTKEKPVHFIDKVVLLYNDINDHTRISNTEDIDKNFAYVYKKHNINIKS